MKYIFLVMIVLSIATSCNQNKETKMKEPEAEKIATELSAHGDKWVDNYYWMRLSDAQKNAETPDEQTTKVINYLNAENDYLELKMKHTEAFQKKLFDEIVGRIKQTDESVPVSLRGYSYYTRYEEGKDYAINCRKENRANATEEIMLNQNEMAKGLAYFAVGGQSISIDNQLLAYGLDTISRRQYIMFFKNLTTGEILKDRLVNTTGNAVWANDNKTVFYTTKDPVTLRSNKIFKHTLGT